jgi:hypothetical protein
MSEIAILRQLRDCFRIADNPRPGFVADNLRPALKVFPIADDQHEGQAVLTVPIRRGAANRGTADHSESGHTSGLL